MDNPADVDRPRRPKRRSLLIAAGGAVLSLALGTGLFAVLSDSITSEDNDFSSGTYAVQDAHDVRAALVDDSDPNVTCDAQTALNDGPLTAAISAQLIDLQGGAIFQPTDSFCVRNDGSTIGRLRASVANVLDTEVGQCEPSEVDAGDTSCVDGSAGDLSGIVEWSIGTWSTYTSASCQAGSWSGFDPMSTAVIDTDLAPGETCRVYLLAQVSASATEQQRLQAQTDRVQFDLVFTLEDAPQQ